MLEFLLMQMLYLIFYILTHSFFILTLTFLLFFHQSMDGRWAAFTQYSAFVPQFKYLPIKRDIMLIFRLIPKYADVI